MTKNCNHITRTKCFDGRRHVFQKIGWSELRPKWYVKWCSRCGALLNQYQQRKTFADVVNGFVIPGCIVSINFESEEENGKNEKRENGGS